MFQLDEHDAMQQAQDEMQRKLDEHNERLDNQDEELHELADAMIQERARRATWEAARDRRELFRCAFQSLFSMLILLVVAYWHGTVHSQPAMKPVQSDPFQQMKTMPKLAEPGNNSAVTKFRPMKPVQSVSCQQKQSEPLFDVLLEAEDCEKIVCSCGMKWQPDREKCDNAWLWGPSVRKGVVEEFVAMGSLPHERLHHLERLAILKTDRVQISCSPGTETSNNDTDSFRVTLAGCLFTSTDVKDEVRSWKTWGAGTMWEIGTRTTIFPCH